MPTQLRDDLQATLGSGFHVVRELPAGGMSRVFVAREDLLQREIVVKLLPPDLMAGLVERATGSVARSCSPRSCSTPISCRCLRRG